jgi:thiamine-monophosphate kinase
VIVGPGDDAAVLRPTTGMDLVLTTDALIENRHFRRDWCRTRARSLELARAVGARLAAANLSDLAAMAARPRWAVISIGATGRDTEWLAEVQRGVAETLERDGAALVGGNLGRAEAGEWYSLTLAGEVEPGRAWTRGGARPGDLLAVTGFFGRAATFGRRARAYWSGRRLPEWTRAFAERWRNPPSRIAAARAMAESGAVTAAIDVSDGLAGDLAHLCEASGVGAEIDASSKPADGLEEEFPRVSDERRFGSSDDYELLLAVDPNHRAACESAAAGAGAPLAFIGRVTAEGRRMLGLRGEDGRVVALPGRGYDHFARR